MNNRQLVSVIMNCYNGEKYLREAIDSVYSQTYQNWEIIFWDNASTDKSAEIAKSYDERLCYFKGKETIPLGAARNKALEQCSGEFIAFLDCDDVWMPDKLLKQVDYMLRNNDVILCHTDGYHMYYNKISENRFSSNSKVYNEYVFKHLIQHNYINIQTILINKKLACNELYFNDNYHYSEEKELFLRLSLIGNFGYINEPLACYRMHDNNISWNVKLIINDSNAIFNQFGDEIQKYDIKLKSLYARLYRTVVLTLLRQKKYEIMKQYLKYLIRYWNIKNVIIALIILLGLGNIFSFQCLNFLRKPKYFLKSLRK